MYILQINFCSGQSGQLKLGNNEQAARDIWAEEADKLLLGQELTTKAPIDVGHPVQVSLIKVSDLDPNDPGSLNLSVFRTCADLHEASAPEPKLYVTGGAR